MPPAHILTARARLARPYHRELTRMSSLEKAFLRDLWQDGDDRCARRRPVLLGAHVWWDMSTWVLLLGTALYVVAWIVQGIRGLGLMAIAYTRSTWLV